MQIQLNLGVPAGFPHLKAKDIPARDRVIDMGRYKGRMLGTLPSTYLKWVSNNLRAGDTLEWATLADQVLADPVYADRMEWEMAENNAPFTSPVSELAELSARFDWDYEDKQGWSRIDFALLGTSKAARIPRRPPPNPNPINKSNDGTSNTNRLQKKKKKKKGEGEASSEGKNTRRQERRERMRRQQRVQADGGGLQEIQQPGDEQKYNENKSPSSPFPGRQSLLNLLHSSPQIDFKTKA